MLIFNIKQIELMESFLQSIYNSLRLAGRNGLLCISLLVCSVAVLTLSFGLHLLDYFQSQNSITEHDHTKHSAHESIVSNNTPNIQNIDKEDNAESNIQSANLKSKDNTSNKEQKVSELSVSHDKKFTIKSGLEVFQVVLGEGETFYQKLINIGFSDSASYVISNSVDKQFKLSKIRSNQKITFVLPTNNEALIRYDDQSKKINEIKTLNVLIGNKLLQIDFNLKKKSYDVKVIVHNTQNDDLAYTFDTTRLSPYPEINNDIGDVNVTKNQKSNVNSVVQIKQKGNDLNYSSGSTKLVSVSGRTLVNGSINAKSFFNSLQKAGVPVDLIHNTVSVLNNVVDFKRDLTNNSHFTILYEPTAKKGGYKLLYIKLSTKKQPKLEIYRYESKDGKVNYYGKNGTNIKKSLLITPVKGAKISSTFGPRMHPTLHSIKMHHGVDYRANKGTPVIASGDGVVEKVMYHGQYGRCMKVKHNKTYSTFYAHMHAFATGLKAGSHVKQGQIIGYVGATGRCTGDHLHYELHQNGVRINPMKVKGLAMPDAELSKVQLAAFESYKKSIDNTMHQIQVAENTQVITNAG